MGRAHLHSCPYCQGLGRVGDDLECRFCAGTGTGTGKVVYPPDHQSEETSGTQPSATVDLLSPAEVDRTLSATIGTDWRRTTFEIDIRISTETYHVAHTTDKPNELRINGRAFYSDVWG